MVWRQGFIAASNSPPKSQPVRFASRLLKLQATQPEDAQSTHVYSSSSEQRQRNKTRDYSRTLRVPSHSDIRIAFLY